MQKKRKSRERGGFLVVLRSMLMSWLTKLRAGGNSLRTIQGAAADVTIPQNT
jgi:hypothetical protein